jgi:hypothetical protein
MTEPAGGRVGGGGGRSRNSFDYSATTTMPHTATNLPQTHDFGCKREQAGGAAVISFSSTDHSREEESRGGSDPRD